MKKLLVVLMLLTLASPALADSTNDDNDQTNTSGSNTQITGGYEATTTNNNDGQTNTTTSTNSTTNSTTGSDIPVGSANAPSYSAMSQDVCSMGVSGSITTLGLGISGGKHIRDLNCERIKLSKVLFDYGMKVAAVSILCQDERVFEAMLMAGTPCPFEGKIGKEAIAQWNKYDVERPDYKSYVSKLETRSQIDQELEVIEQHKRDQDIIKEEEAKRLKDKEDKSLKEALIKKDFSPTENVVIKIHK
tara:strand:- start:620 stop:1360 length:741 start_codon:yes stop_codon:yes gene_type:complete